VPSTDAWKMVFSVDRFPLDLGVAGWSGWTEFLCAVDDGVDDVEMAWKRDFVMTDGLALNRCPLHLANMLQLTVGTAIQSRVAANANNYVHDTVHP
jgi:hypothetical protein